MAEFAAIAFYVVNEPEITGDVRFLSVEGIAKLPDSPSNLCFEFDDLLLVLSDVEDESVSESGWAIVTRNP